MYHLNSFHFSIFWGMFVSLGSRSRKKKSTNELNPIYCNTPTPEKRKQELHVMEEDEDYALSLS